MFVRVTPGGGGGGGGLPYGTDGDARGKFLNLTPKGDQSACGLSKF